jgi:hypothetical protein
VKLLVAVSVGWSKNIVSLSKSAAEGLARANAMLL